MLKITTIKILNHKNKIKLKHSKFSVLVNEKTYLHGKIQLDFFSHKIALQAYFLQSGESVLRRVCLLDETL